MLPDAFTWTIVRQDAEQTMLRYVPNPAFQPPTLEARVLAAMEGEMVVTREGDRIARCAAPSATMSPSASACSAAWTAAARSSSSAARSARATGRSPETHVHIGGHALLFKNIGQNSDEVKTEWKPSTAATLAEGARDLGVLSAPVHATTAQ